MVALVVNELFEKLRVELGLLQAGHQHLLTVKEVLQFCMAELYAVAILLQEPTSSKAGPAAVVLIRAEEWCQMEREFADERVNRLHSMSEDSDSRVGAPGGTRVEYVGQLYGAKRQ